MVPTCLQVLFRFLGIDAPKREVGRDARGRGFGSGQQTREPACWWACFSASEKEAVTRLRKGCRHHWPPGDIRLGGSQLGHLPQGTCAASADIGFSCLGVAHATGTWGRGLRCCLVSRNTRRSGSPRGCHQGWDALDDRSCKLHRALTPPGGCPRVPLSKLRFHSARESDGSALQENLG